MNPRIPKLRHGFTLVELLVVIGIIALLISIIMPSLSAARRQAQQIQCAANLRQLGQMTFLYSTAYKGMVPIGTRSQNKQSNFWVDANEGELNLFGFYYNAGYMKGAPTLLYCPVQRDPLQSFNTTSNIWPPVATDTQKCRAGYSMRPDYRMQWTKTGTTYTPAGLPVGIYKFTVDKFTTLTTLSPSSMPRLRSFVGKSIMSDVIRGAANLTKMGHGTGYNVMRDDGSVRYIRKDFFADALAQLDASDDDFSTASNAPIDAMWKAFDQY